MDLRQINQEGSLENYIMRTFTINSAPGTVTVIISEHTKLVGDSGVPRRGRGLGGGVSLPPPKF